jgi:predicted Zn-dependent protease
MVHRLENKFAYAVAALVFTAISLWLFVEYGIPELAKRAAFAAPPSISTRLGSEGLTILDKVLFKPSELSDERKAEFVARLSEIKSRIEDAPELKIVFRKGGVVGANAFALPSGTIVFTDELIELSEDDLEVTAILAHEVGHVTGRHSLRMILQNSTVALIISSITGDITSITALSATIPTILVEAKYSKGFEREADTYALTYLKDAGVDTIHFANILERMEKARGGGDNGKFNYLSSHPATKERVERFK